MYKSNKLYESYNIVSLGGVKMTYYVDAERIHQKRICNGFSRRRLSQLSGVSELTIFNLENKRTNANPHTIKKICDALQLDVEEIYNFNICND